MRKSRLFFRPLFMLAVVAALAFGASSSARAAVDSPCSIGIIGLDQNGERLRLKVQCDGGWYYTNTGASCASTSNELVKMWESMAMSAMLAGKKVNVHYHPATSDCVDRMIYNLDVIK